MTAKKLPLQKSQQNAPTANETQTLEQNPEVLELQKLLSRLEALEKLVATNGEQNTPPLGGTPQEGKQASNGELTQLLNFMQNQPSLPEMSKDQTAVSDECAAEVMKRDLFEIKQAFPFETADDISAIKNADDFFKYRFGIDHLGKPFQKNTATDAYFLALRDNRPESYTSDKSHFVSPKGSTGKALLDVPSDVKAIYKRLMPNISDSDIAKHYTESKRK